MRITCPGIILMIMMITMMITMLMIMMIIIVHFERCVSHHKDIFIVLDFAVQVEQVLRATEKAMEEVKRVHGGNWSFQQNLCIWNANTYLMIFIFVYKQNVCPPAQNNTGIFVNWKKVVAKTTLSVQNWAWFFFYQTFSKGSRGYQCSKMTRVVSLIFQTKLVWE